MLANLRNTLLKSYASKVVERTRIFNSSVPVKCAEIQRPTSRPSSVSKSKPKLSTSVIDGSGVKFAEHQTSVKRIKAKVLTKQLKAESASEMLTNKPDELPVESQYNDDIDERGDDYMDDTGFVSIDTPDHTKRTKKVNNSKAITKERNKQLLVDRYDSQTDSLNDLFICYLQACVYCGYDDQAFSGAMSSVSKGTVAVSRGHNFPLQIEPINFLLKELLKQGKYDKIKKLLDKLLSKKYLQPSVDTFALWLISLEKTGNINNSDELDTFLETLNEQNITMEQVWHDSVMAYDNMQSLVNAITQLDHDLSVKLQDRDYQEEVTAQRMAYARENTLIGSLTAQTKRPKSRNFITEEELMKGIDEQYELEEKMYLNIPKSVTPLSTSNSSKATILKEEYLAFWRKTLKQVAQMQRETSKDAFDSQSVHKMSLHPFTASLSDDDIVEITLKYVDRLIIGAEGPSTSLTRFYKLIGADINHRCKLNYRATHSFSQTKEAFKEYCQEYLATEKGHAAIPRVSWAMIMQKRKMDGLSMYEVPDWPVSLQCSLGKIFMNNILNCLAFWTEKKDGEKLMHQAFYKVRSVQDGRTFYCVVPHDKLLETYMAAESTSIRFPSEMLPMLCPPMPWMSATSGAYLNSRNDLLRLPLHAKQQLKLLKEADPKRVFPVLDALNQLGSVPWIINQPILDLVTEIFENGGDAEVGVAETPIQAQPMRVRGPESSAHERFQNVREHDLRKKRQSEMHSLRCDALYKVTLANHYRDRVFWLPQNLDFRGRAYPIPPHMTHISADVFRAFMMFSQGQKLGATGLRWLKIHVVNMTGQQKRNSVVERLQYCEDHLDDIFDSADHPLEGRRWWCQSDDAWQTLAACKELTNALRSDQPEEFISHLPIHQDGSCNGLQHYAALGRDTDGAVAVNLELRERPEDVYSTVALKAEERRKIDAANGDACAQSLDGCITRKVVKQTVMTTVYGVTRHGARSQIYKQVKDIAKLDETQQLQGSQYLTDIVFECIKDMFTGSKEIQNWFKDLSDYLCVTLKHNIDWVTPLGLPVSQPYSVNKDVSFVPSRFHLQFKADLFLKPCSRKQKNGFPPNFIHSLDSCHMMLTSLACQQEGLTFASVHDCFWTHASSVDQMSQICREQFVALHSEPILENLSQHFKTKYPPMAAEDATDRQCFDNIPKKGDFNLKNVLDSVFFFS